MSKIEWTDKTWNPTTGCNKVSQGCKNCYAEVMHRRQQAMNPHKYTKGFSEGVETHVSEMQKPLHWKKPCKIFVNSMSDIFHADVPFEFIYDVFLIMQRANWHTFQVLTKRPERAAEFFKTFNVRVPENVWIGTSCEDQATADERILHLIKIPASVRFLSCEPLLGPIDLCLFNGPNRNFFNLIHWVITGGESGHHGHHGHHARPVNPDWIRSLRDQCKAASIPFFFKQWGEYAFVDGAVDYRHDGTYPHEHVSVKMGKSKTGNFLDGIHHMEFPQTLTD